MASRFRDFRDPEAQDALDQVPVAPERPQIDIARAQTLARSTSNPDAQRLGNAMLVADERQQAQDVRQAATDQRAADVEARRQQSEQERQAKAEQARSVRAAAAAGAETVTDIETGRRTVATHPDGAVKYETGPVGQPVIQPTAEAAASSIPGMGGFMSLTRPADQQTLGQTQEVAQTYRDDRGGMLTAPLPTKTDPKTGAISSTVKDPVTGRPTEVPLGTDQAIQAKVAKDAELEQRRQALALRDNAVKQTRLQFQPKWEPVKKEFDEAGKDLNAFTDPEKVKFIRDPKTGKMAKRDPNTGRPSREYVDPNELVKWQKDQADIQARHDRAKAAHDKLEPFARNLNRNETELKDAKLKLVEEKIRHDAGMPDDDGGAATTLARASGEVEKPAGLQAVDEHVFPMVYAPEVLDAAQAGEKSSGNRYPVGNAVGADLEYFRQNPGVTGMAIGAGLNESPKDAPRTVVLNPFAKNPDGSPMTDQQKSAVVMNESLRHFMDEKKPRLAFEPTAEQVKFFAGTEYGKPENRERLKETIIARILTGDESAGKVTPEQEAAAQAVMTQFNAESSAKPLVPTDSPDKAKVFADAFGGLVAADKLTLGASGEGFQFIQREGANIGSVDKDKHGTTFVTMGENLNGTEDLRQSVAFGTTTGVPVYLHDTAGVPRDTVKEAQYVASIFDALKDPILAQDKAMGAARLNMLDATPAAIARKVSTGELSIQHGEAIMKEVYNSTLKADDPLSPETFGKWISGADQEVKDKYTAAAKAKDTAALNAIKNDYASEWYVANRGKPGVNFKTREIAAAALTGKLRTGEKASALGGGLVEAGGSMVGMLSAPGMLGYLAVNELANGSDADSRKAMDDTLSNYGRASKNTWRGWELSREKWFTGEGKAKLSVFEDAQRALGATIRAQDGYRGGIEDPEWKQEYKARVDAVTDAAYAMHAMNLEEGWEVTRDDLDPSKNPGLAKLVNGYAITGDRSLLDGYFKALMEDHGTRQAQGYLADLTMGRGKFMSALISGANAPPEEIGVEIASTILTAGIGKAVFGGAKTAKLMEAGAEAATSASRMTRFRLGALGIKNEFMEAGMVADTLATPASKLGKASNFIVKGAKVSGANAVSEGLEEAAMSPADRNANADSIIKDAAMGALAGFFMGPVMAGPSVLAQSSRQAYDQNQAAKTFADAYNSANRGAEGFTPVTVEQANTAMALAPDDVRVKLTEASKAATTNLIAAVEAAKNSTDPVVLNALSRAQAVSLITHDALATDAAMRTEAVIAIQNTDPANKDFAMALAKVASGRTDLLTGVERSAVAGKQTQDGKPYFATVQKFTPEGEAVTVDVVTDAGRAEAMQNFPQVAALIQTTESQAIFDAAQQATTPPPATNEQDPQGQQSPPPQDSQPAPTDANAPVPGGGNGATAPVSGGTGAPAPQAPVSGNAAAMDAAEYTALRSQDPTLPDIPAVVAAARAAGQPVSPSMEKEAGTPQPGGQPVSGSGQTVSDPALDEASGVASAVVAKVEAAMPSLKGRFVIADGEHGGGAEMQIETGKIILNLPAIKKAIKRAGGDIAKATAILETIVARHEVVHVVQTQALRPMWEAAGKPGTFEGFFLDYYATLAPDLLTKQASAAARQIYSKEQWDRIPSNALKAAEFVRMLVEAKLDPAKTGEFSELFRSIENRGAKAKITALIKAAVEMLRKMKLTGAAAEHVAKVEELYRELTEEAEKAPSVEPAPAPSNEGVKPPPPASPTVDQANPERFILLAKDSGQSEIRLNGEVIWRGPDADAQAELESLQAAQSSPMRITGDAIKAALVKFPRLSGKLRGELEAAADEIMDELDAVPAGERMAAAEKAIADRIDRIADREAERTGKNRMEVIEGFRAVAGKRASQQAASIEQAVIGSEAPQVPEGKQESRPTPNGEMTVDVTSTYLDLSQLVGSSDPLFPGGALQPRNRSTQASQNQREEMVQNLRDKPDQARRYIEGVTTDAGRMIVAPLFAADGTHMTNEAGKPLFYVLSGNGRRNALAEAATRKVSGPVMKGFREASAAEGIDTESMTLPVPVAVFVPQSAKEAIDLAEYSNRDAQLSVSNTEQANRDASSIEKANILKLWEPDATGDPAAASNRDFVKAFARAVGDEGILDTRGELTDEGAKRIERAMVAMLLGPDQGPVMDSLFNRSGALGLRAILGGVASETGSLLKLAGAKPDFDLSPVLANALKTAVEAKQAVANGQFRDVSEFFDQGSLFESTENTPERQLARAIVESRSRKAVREILAAYRKGADAVDTSTMSMFAEEETTRESLILKALEARPVEQVVAEIEAEFGKSSDLAAKLRVGIPAIKKLDAGQRREFMAGVNAEVDRLRAGVMSAEEWQRLNPDAMGAKEALFQRFLDSHTAETIAGGFNRLLSPKVQGVLGSSAEQVDPRLIKEFGENFDADEYGLPKAPVTLPDGHPLLENTKGKKTAILLEDHRLVTGGYLPAGQVSRKELGRAIIRFFMEHGTTLTGKPTPLAQGTQPVVYATGGGGGAGKSTILKFLQKRGDIDLTGAVLVNADDIKEMIPEFEEMKRLGDGRAAATVHEESSQLAKNLLDVLLNPNAPQRFNFIYDATLGHPESSRKHFDRWKSVGYLIHFVGVTIDPREAMIRAVLRGKGSGRWVPSSMLAEAHQGFNRGVDGYISMSDRVNLIDNTPPKFHEIGKKSQGEDTISIVNAEYLAILRSRESDVPKSSPQSGSRLRGMVGGGTSGGESGGRSALRQVQPEGGGSRSQGTGGTPGESSRLGSSADQGFDLFGSIEPAIMGKRAKTKRNMVAAAMAQPADSKARTNIAKQVAAKEGLADLDLFAAAAVKSLDKKPKRAQSDGNELDLFSGTRSTGDRQSDGNPASQSGQSGTVRGMAGEQGGDLFAPGVIPAGFSGSERSGGSRGGRGATSDGPAGDSGRGATGESDSTGTRGDRRRRDGGTAGPDAGLIDLGETSIPDVIATPANEADRNARINPGETLVPKGQGAKIAANFKVIDLLRQLTTEARNPTELEKAQLLTYSGWGHSKGAFDDSKAKAFETRREDWLDRMWQNDKARFKREQNYRQPLPGGKEKASTYDLYAWNEKWGETHRELHERLSDKEYNAAKRSVLNAHYTTPAIIDAQWQMVEKLGFKGGRALEPGGGIGHYIGTQPQHLAERTIWSAVELDQVTAQILALLYPQARVNSVSPAPGREVVGQGFEEALIADNSQDIVISNVPFHETGPWQSEKQFKQKLNLHNYFFARALQKVKPGGFVVFITSSSTMENNSDQRRFLASRGELISAVRLPNNAFEENAGTQVTTDIIILRKPDGRKVESHSWLGTRVVGRDTVNLKRGDQTPIQYLKSFDLQGTWQDETLEAARKAWDDLRQAGLKIPDGKEFKADQKANATATAEAWKSYVKAFELAESNSIGLKLGAELPIRVNEYFAANPQNAFGRHSLAGSMYKADEYALQEDLAGGTLEQRFAKVIEALPSDIMGQASTVKLGTVQDIERSDKPFSFVERDGKFWQVQKNHLEPVEWSNGEIVVFRSWNRVKNAIRDLIAAELDPTADPAEVVELRDTLNKDYGKHIGQFGPISKTGVGQKHGHLSEDPDFPLTVALEEPVKYTDRKGKSATRYDKADIFRVRMNKPLAPPVKAESVSDALLASLVWMGYPHAGYMAKLLGRPEAAVRQEMIESELVFDDPTSGNLVIRDSYLSGFVQGKLDEAKAAAVEDPAYRRNVAALEAALPERKGIAQIGVSMNSPWLPPEVMTAFMESLGLSEAGATYSVAANSWTVAGFGNSDELSTADVPTVELIQHALAMTVPRVSNYEGRGADRKLVFDPAATQIAKSKLDKLKMEFQRWAKTSDAEVNGTSVQEIIVQAFNEKANGIKPPSFKGEHITLPGASDEVFRSGIRRAAIARMIDQGSGMIAHGVGFGKTYTLIALAMELKRLGKANRPMIIVENATLTQFAASFRTAYPNARVLVADEKSFAGPKRRQFIARIATGDHDAILMAHSQFNLIGNHPDVVNSYINEQVKELEDARALTDSSDARAVAALEKAKIGLENSRKKILDALASRQDVGMTWEDLGIDTLLVDEAHRYKNAPVITRMQGMKNLPTGAPSQRAIGMVIKTKGIQDKMAGRGVFFATGTPVSNSMAEAYVMLRYTSPHLLKQSGIENFDQFVASFGVSETKAEANWKGAISMETRLSKFINGNALINLIRSSWDVQMDPDVAGIKRPTIKGGAAEQVMVKPGPANQAYNNWVVNTIAPQWEDPGFWDSMGGKKQAFEDNPWMSAVPIMTMQAGIAAALDIRLIDPNAADFEDSKVNTAVRKIVENYKATKSYLGTQAVFADLRESFSVDHLLNFAGDPGLSEQGMEIPEVAPVAVDADGNPLEEQPAPKKVKKVKAFDLYQDIAAKLVKANIPRSEIGLISSSMSPEKRSEMFDKVNSGEIRVIVGSTDLMGVGVNMQERLYALHHLMPPRDFKPASQEQRTGRILRQGNLHYDMALEAFVASAEASTGQTFRKDKGGRMVPDMVAAAAALEGNESALTTAAAAAEVFHIQELQYAMEKSIDSAIFSMMASKQRMVVQLLMGEVTDSFEDPSDAISMGMAEIAARAIGDPTLIRRVELEREIRNLNMEFQGFQNDLMSAKASLRFAEGQIAESADRLAKAQRFADSVGKIGTDTERETVWEFGGQTVDRNKPKDAEKGWKAPKLIESLDLYLAEESRALNNSDRKKADVPLVVDGVKFTVEIHQSLGDTRSEKEKYDDQMAGKNSSRSAVGVVYWSEGSGNSSASAADFSGAQSLISSINGLAKKARNMPESVESEAAYYKRQLPSLQFKASQTFDRSDELAALYTEMDEVEARLANNANPQARTPKAKTSPKSETPANYPGKGLAPAMQTLGSSAFDDGSVRPKLSKEEREPKIAEFKRLKTLALELSGDGNLTAQEAKRFEVVNSQINSLIFDLAPRPKIEKLQSADARMSTLPFDVVSAAWDDQMRSRPIWMALAEAANGVHFNKDTAVDDILNGKNPRVSAEDFRQAFEGTRAALRSEFGEAMTLFRAGGLQKTKLTTNWATTSEFAAQFGGRVQSAEIPVAQIVAVNVGPNGNYHEMIVENATLGSSEESSAVQEALAKMPPMYRKVFEDIEAGDSPAVVMKRHDITERAVTNILNQVRARIAVATAAAGDTLKPAMRDGLIDGGRPDLALSTNPTITTVDQARNESDVPDVRGWDEVNAKAADMLAKDYQGTYDMLLGKARDLQPMTDQEVAAAKMIIARETISGKITTAADRVKLGMMIYGYREIGTETARSLAIRRDPHLRPAERHAQFIAEALFTPDAETRRRMKSNPKAAETILAGWMQRVDAIEAELLAQGIDIRAALAEFNANQESLKQTEAESPRAAKVIEEQIRKLGRREKAVIEAIRSGSLISKAAFLTGLSTDEVKAIYSRFLTDIRSAMAESAKRFLAGSLGSSSGDMMSEILTGLGLPDIGMIDDTQADFVDRRNEKPRAPRKPRAPKAPETEATEGKTYTPEQIIEMEAAWERFKATPTSRWSAFWQETMEKLTPMIGQTSFERFKREALRPWWDVWQTEMEAIAPDAPKGPATPRMTFEEWIAKPWNQEQINRQDLLELDTRLPINETTGTWNETRPFTGQGELIRPDINETTGTFDIHDPVSVKAVMDAFAVARGGKMDALMEFWKMSILTGPQTHIVNVGSNALNSAFNLLPRRGVEALVNNLLGIVGQGSDRAATFAEFAPMAKNLRKGVQLAARMALRSWQAETRTFEAYARAEALQLDFSGVGSEYIPPALGGKIGKVMRSLSFRAMTAADEFQKSLYAQMEAAAQSHRIAAVEEKLTGPAYAKRIDELMQPGSKAWIRAIDEAKRITFQDEIDGTNPQAIRRIDQLAELAKKGRNMPWIGRPLTFFLPFIDTPTNIFKQAVEMSPLGGFLSVVDMSRALKRRVMSGTLTKAEAQAEAELIYDRARLVRDLTNQTIAWAAFFALQGLVGGDDGEDELPVITGTVPYKTTRRGERDNAFAVMPPQTIRLGDVQVSYARVEPFATLMASTVDLLVSMNRHGGFEPAVASEWFMRFKDQAKDKTFLQGVSNLLNAVEDPDRFAERLTSNIVSGFVPNIIRQPVREADSVIRDQNPAADDGFFTAVAKRVGFTLVPQMAPAKMDVWGNEVKTNRGDQVGGTALTDAAFRIFDPTNARVNPDIDPIDRWIFLYNLQTADSKDRVVIEPISNSVSGRVPGEKRPRVFALTSAEQAEANRAAGQAARSALGEDWKNQPLNRETAEQIMETVRNAQRVERERLRAEKLAEIP